MSNDIQKDVDAPINVDDIRRRGEYVREWVLNSQEVTPEKTAPNHFNYRLHTNSIGLNEVSNVDLGYAGTTIDGVNLSKRQPYLADLEYNVNIMKYCKNAILILNGGLFTFIPKSRNGQLLSYADQISYFYSLFKDLAHDGKIVAMVRGTEEHRILRNHGVDVLKILQDALGINNKVCNEAFVNIALDDDIVENAEVGIKTINWNNSASTINYISRKMDERATKRGGADIYLARTTKNFFKTSIIGQIQEGKVEKKPIYLISSGGYTPFKGAMTAGAEYNSIKDGELCPNNFWYEVTVEKRQDGEPGKPYFVRVNPIEYIAHQVNEYSTDKTATAIANSVSAHTDDFIEYLLDNYPKAIGEVRELSVEQLRKILANNKSVASNNDEIARFKKMQKSGVFNEYERAIEDLSLQENDSIELEMER